VSSSPTIAKARRGWCSRSRSGISCIGLTTGRLAEAWRSSGVVKSYSQIDSYGLKFWSHFISTSKRFHGVRYQGARTNVLVSWILTPDTWNHVPIDWNKTRIKFRGHGTCNFHLPRCYPTAPGGGYCASVKSAQVK
jgi:hypothetical protein